MEIEIRRPDDWHLHLRDGAAMAAVLPFTARAFRARHRDAESQAAGDHHRSGRSNIAQRILAALPAGARFTPLMTLYLTDRTDPTEIDAAPKASGVVYGLQALPGRRDHQLRFGRHRHPTHRCTCSRA